MNETIYIVRLTDVLGNKMELTTDCYECANGIYDNVRWTEEIETISFVKDENGIITPIRTFNTLSEDDVDITSLIGKE